MTEPAIANDSPRPAHPALDVRHDTFTLERHLPGTPAAVFDAFADEPTRRAWFRLPGSGATYRHQFRVGDGEDAHSSFRVLDAEPEVLGYHSHYLDIVTDRRMVFAYTAVVDDVTRWASLVTVLIADDNDGGSVLTWTEQVSFLARTGDGSADLPHLRTGTSLRLNGLAKALDAN